LDAFAGIMALLCSIVCLLIVLEFYSTYKKKQFLSFVSPLNQYFYIITTICAVILLFITVSASINCVFMLSFDAVNPKGEFVLLYPDANSPPKHLSHINCEGEGSPVVLLFHGLGGQALDWSWIQPTLTNLTRVCSFDRSGYGWSELGTFPRTSGQISQDLIELLTELDLIDQKFILVGHSMAGFNMLVFNHMFPNHTLGIACLDCVDANDTDVTPGILTLGQHLLPLGIVRILFSSPISETRVIYNLPEDVQWNYLQNILKPNYWLTRINEINSWHISAQETRQSGYLAHMPFLVFAAGRGLNNTNLVQLSSKSCLYEFPDVDHYLPFYKETAMQISTKLIEFIISFKNNTSFQCK
jgi:pimeloyl-ACP methyl ester carboxylesterase